jgi:hypothetical protein
VLRQGELGRPQDAVKALTKRKSSKRRYVQTEKTLIVSEVSNILAAKDSSGCKEGEKPIKRVCAERCCSRCGKIRHNSCTCKVEIEEVEDSDASE